MSDWKSRAQPVPSSTPTSDWKSRAEVVPHEDSTLESIGQDIGDTAMGLGQGGTLGFGDELLGAGQAAYDVATDPEKKLEDLANLYREHQQKNEKAYDEAKERSPWLTTAGEIGGGALLAGPLGLTAEGATMGANALKLAKIGAVAGAGGSKGTIENNPLDIAKDSAVGFGLGAAAAPIGAGLGKGLDKLGKVAQDSPLLKKLGYTWDAVKNRGMNFTGAKAGEEIRRDVNTTADSITKQLMQPLEDSSALFGQEIADATGKGAKLNHSEDTLKTLDAVKSLLLKKGGGQAAKDALELLGSHGSQKLNPETLQTMTGSLDPRQVKDLQLLLRKLRGSKVYEGEGVLHDADDVLRNGLEGMLPESVHTKMNQTFSNARDILEPALNKGKIDGPKSVSDINPDELNSRVQDYIKKMLKNGQDSNDLGVEAKGSMSDLLNAAKNVNEKNQLQFVNPDQIARQFEDTSMKHAIRKGIYGDKAQDALAKPGILDFITGSPYRAVEGAAKVARGVSNSKVVQAGKSLYNVADDNLHSIADTLNNNGMGYMGNALKTALENKSSAAKNAALFSIMQNPKSRKLIGMDGVEGNEE